MAEAEKYTFAANNRKEAIQKYCWNENEGCYFDYDYVAGKQKQSLTLAGFFPLFLKLLHKIRQKMLQKICDFFRSRRLENYYSKHCSTMGFTKWLGALAMDSN